MRKVFNTEGVCDQELHYMVDISSRLEEIKKLIDKGAYFTVNRARQYGKTTTLMTLQKYISEWYNVIYMDFQFMGDDDFSTESSFAKAFASEFEYAENIPEEFSEELSNIVQGKVPNINLRVLFNTLSQLCKISEKPIVMIIDEVDSATNNQVFIDFLSQLRGYYLHRKTRPTFQSVILAGVYDVKNIKRKIRPDDEKKSNSPWNIATDFDIDMSFSKNDIFRMIEKYEKDCNTGMDIDEMAGLIYEYTSGYPYLVSRLCQLIDVKIAQYPAFKDTTAWTKDGLLEAVKCLLMEKNPLFDSLINKLHDYPELREMLYAILFIGDRITFNADNNVINLATMFGFVVNDNGLLAIANRVFETRLYNFFLSEEELNNRLYTVGTMDKNQFIQNGTLNMELVLKKFMVHWGDLYGSADEKFIEDNGRKFFLLYLKPIINGIGNYYIEAQTRDNKRTDVIVDYCGKQYIIEIKIWRGNEYNKRGEIQLKEYLETYHAQKGYLLSFNFNKNKKTGIKEIDCGGKTIIEVVV